MAHGLRTKFAQYAPDVFKTLLDKCKEKKVEHVVAALDVVAAHVCCLFCCVNVIIINHLLCRHHSILSWMFLLKAYRNRRQMCAHKQHCTYRVHYRYKN
jgi:hypothetical protein